MSYVPLLLQKRTFSGQASRPEPEQRAWDPTVSRWQNSIHATALERIEFGSLSLSARFWPTIGDVKRYGTYRRGYLRYGMINLGNCHAETQWAPAKFKIY